MKRFLLCMFVGACLAGCAQNVEPVTDQQSYQDLATPTSTDQEQATQGSQVNIWVVNAPGSGSKVSPPTEDPLDSLIQNLSNQGTEVEKVASGYTQAGINITVTTGGTTPSVSGQTTATPTVSQYPTQSPVISPPFRVDPETGIAFPIAVGMPGAMIDQAASASAGGGDSATDQATGSKQANIQQLEAAASKLSELAPILEKFIELTTTPQAPPEDVSTNGV